MRCLTAVAFLVCATPVLADSHVDLEILADVVETIAAHDCRLAEDQAAPLFEPMGYDRDDVRPIVDWLVETGAGAIDGSAIVLTDAVCASAQGAPGATDTDAQFAVMLQIFQDNGCAVGSDQMEEAFALRGLGEDDTAVLLPRLQQMVLEGQLTFDRDTDIASLSGDLCEGGAAAVSPRDILLQIFADNGCEQPMSQLMFSARALGLDTGQVEIARDVMVDAGEIDDADSRVVILRPDLCQPSPVTRDDPVLAALASLADENCQLLTTGLLRRLEENGVAREMVLYHDLRLRGLVQRGVAQENGLIITLPLALCGGAAVPEMTAENTPDAAFAQVVAVMRAGGCTMKNQDVLSALLATGLTEAQLLWAEPLFDLHEIVGNVTLNRADGTMSLSAALCEGAAPLPTARDQIVRVLNGAGCTMTQDDALAALAVVGLDEDDFDRAFDVMQVLDELQRLGGSTALSADVTTRTPASLTLLPPLCVAAQSAAVDVRAAVIAALAANDCRLTESQGEAVLPDFGITMEDSEPVVDAMIAEGIAIMAAGALILSPSACAAALRQ